MSSTIRQDPPIANTAAARIGPATTPIEPASVQRAIKPSLRPGSLSTRIAWDVLTKAPDAG